MSRYFMLIPEAVSLVLQAGSMGFGGELFVLDMGEPVNILEMAETLIKLHGYEPYEEVKIEFNGIRPGEKLYEELFYDPDHVDKTANDKIYLSKLTEGKKTPLTEIKRLLSSSAKGEIDQPTLKEEILELAKGESQ
jgi:FlaA1/EpsC-like NDP-sugar epimerase